MDWLNPNITTDELATHLSGLSTRKLAEVLAKRPDLTATCVNAEGRVDGAIWPLRKDLGPVACVDGIAMQINNGVVEGGVIRRLTGKFPNKIAYIGGVVPLYVSIEEAMRRHFGTDLGLEITLPLGWDHPMFMRQYAPQEDGHNRSDFCWDPGKHSYASTHLVVITGDPKNITLGSTKEGGQEAGGFEWYSAHTCPPKDEWSYDMRDGFIESLDIAAAAVDSGRLQLPNAAQQALAL